MADASIFRQPTPCGENPHGPMDIPISSLALTFDQNLLVMTAAVLPAIVLCIMQYVFLDLLGERVQLLSISAAMILAFKAGIAPAFFTRVDHPLHWLDRGRWIVCCMCLTGLLLMASCSNGPVYAYNFFRPHARLSLNRYTEAMADQLGLVTIEDATMDTLQVGAAPHCSDCTAQQCVVKDCRGAAKLPKLPGWDFDDDVSGGGSCSITCLYAAPLYLSLPNATSSSTPVAWAVQNGFPPRADATGVTGTGHIWWWVGTRKDYQGAIDEVILQRFGLSECDGQQPVPFSSMSATTASGHCNGVQGLQLCRAGSKLGRCCCPVGYKVRGGKCVPCATAERVKQLHDLPLVYILHPESGSFAFHLMCFCSLALLSLPWAMFAHFAWYQLLKQGQKDLRHYLVHHQRQRLAERWSSKRQKLGPMMVQVMSMSGETKELGGFFPTTLLAHLRHAVAHDFAIPFSSCGLVLQHVALHPEMDFRTLSDLGIEHGSSLVLVCSNKESRSQRLAGSSESDALSFFRRTAQVYKALDCEHDPEQLRMQSATVANFGEKYTQGWRCDGCEKRFEPGTMLWRCEICVVDFCGECAAACR